MKAHTGNALVQKIKKQLQSLPEESLVKVAEYIEFLRFQARKPARKATGEQLDEAEKQRVLKRVRDIQKRTKKYIPYEEFVREYEKKWGIKLDEVEAEE
ncbi:MAG TPA: hypothetical protein VFD70_22945 [Anaerolineae bacterium]|nr:hypothetical protein [Anaerolineae bacterium]